MVLFRLAILFFCIFKFGLDLSAVAKHDNKTWEVSYKSVVSVLPTWPGYDKPGFGAPSGTAPEGTGFYFTFKKNQDLSKYIMSAYHVIDKATSVEIEDFLGNREIVDVIFSDKKTDIAILKSKKGRIPLKFSKKEINIGNHVCVIGNSFGLGVSLTCGVVSALNRKNLGFNQIEDFIQTDAAVNPGDSGAPLLNSFGMVIGMVDAIYTKEADIDAGVNFAIDKNLIRKILNNINIK